MKEGTTGHTTCIVTIATYRLSLMVSVPLRLMDGHEHEFRRLPFALA